MPTEIPMHHRAPASVHPLQATGVALAGFMGVGKSTVGPVLAARLGLPWWDLDARIEARTGRTIASLFAEEQESGFRQRERAALRAGLSDGPAVISLGGGALLSAEARALLAARGVPVIVLHAPLEVVQARIRGTGRPLGPQAEALFRVRRAHYASLGPRVSTVGRTPEEVVDHLLAAMQERA